MKDSDHNLRGRIIDASSRLFRKHGIRYVTMDEIAKELGISKKTVYAHFESKEILLRESIIARISEQRKKHTLILKNAENVIDGLVQLMFEILRELEQINPQFLDEIQRYYPGIAQQIRKERTQKNMDELLGLLKDGKKEELFRSDLDIQILAKLFMSQMNNISDPEVFPITDYPRPKLFEHAFLMFLRGISTPKGQVFLDQMIQKHKITLRSTL
ncbi:helix-turn-helix domain-containing protein [Balneolaceae bacterium ANBcel3]|nr:helix-turn-helix domain-containing protein [Balneolaceae bacterium ANBcel3]